MKIAGMRISLKKMRNKYIILRTMKLNFRKKTLFLKEMRKETFHNNIGHFIEKNNKLQVKICER